MQKATIGVPERFLSKSEVDMRRRFFGRFKARIPRKLKKAAKYGVKRNVYPAQTRIYVRDDKFVYQENVEYVIVGRRTKWKVMARFAAIKEYKRYLAYMWHCQFDRMIT